MMRALHLLPVVLPLVGAQGVRILQSNDDGWAELNVRTFNDALNQAGYDVVLSAPAENKSGSSSSDAEPQPRTEPCIYDSCAANSGPVGSNATNPRLNWVNSFPVTSVKYGFEVFGPQIWNGERPELVVAGPNTGSNLWLQVPFSGTVGAAAESAKNQKVPAIAFSGGDGSTNAWDVSPVPAAALVYAQLATTLTTAVINSGAPYLPENVFLNVNFPALSGGCTSASDFQWVLSRINPGFISAPDVETCGDDRLPTETEVVGAGCFASISVGDANDKTTAAAEQQAVVLEKIGSLLSCLPSGARQAGGSEASASEEEEEDGGFLESIFG